MLTRAYKAYTQSLSSPIQGGPPVWDGSLPHKLPRVKVDASEAECAAGWNACRDAHTALRIAGLWPDGRPIRLFRVETRGKVIERGEKLRAASWTITEEITDLRPAVLALSEPFGALAEEMKNEQMAWYRALGRPEQDESAVIAGLTAALRHRGMSWKLRQFETVRAAWAVRDAWAAWAVRDAWAAWAAWAALMVFHVSRRGWISHPADLLTVGIRDAYAHGLGIALPTGPDELGWTMDALRPEAGEEEP